MSDFRLAFRTLFRAPGFTAIAVLTLALGIGLSASSFSMANAFLLRTVPYPGAERLVRVFRTSPQGLNQPHAPGNILDIRDTVTSFTGLAIYNGDALALAEPGQPAEQVSALSVTSDFFDVLQVQPQLGRAFVAGEDQPKKPHVAILTHRTWVRRYAADPAVIGREVRLNSEPYTIVGVMPESFDAPLLWGRTEYIVPRTIEANFRSVRSDPWMNAVGRLKPGLGLRQAQAELTTIAARLAHDFPEQNGKDGLRLVEFSASDMDNVSRGLLWLMTALSLTMLLIGCANLASLQVARALSRTREFAVRAALGGGRRQLMVPLLAESALLAVLGGTLGLLVASWSNDLIGRQLQLRDGLGFSIPIDGRVLAFTMFASILSGFAFGCAPAWLAAHAPAAEVLKDGSRGSTSGASHNRIKRALIVVEIALSVALVGVAASFGLGARELTRRPVGWRIDGICSGFVVLPYNRYDDEKCRRFERDVIDKLRAIPGVEHATIATSLPLYSLGRAARVVVDGLPIPERGQEPVAENAVVSAGFFATLGIPLKEGTAFAEDLKASDPAAVIVNESFARRFWPGASAIGRRIRFAENDRWMQIVAVVGDVRMPVRLDAPPTTLQLYRPLVQSPSHYFTIAVRGSMRADMLVNPLRQTVASLDADLPVAHASSLRTEVDRVLKNLQLVITNLAVSAGMGLLIASVGLFGVISQLTVQRTRDIGVRMALGAQGSDIMRMILGEGARLLVAGLVLGLPLLVALNMIVQRSMPEVPMPGAWLVALNTVVLTGTMLFATWLPARRATLINPVEALRAE